MWSRLRLRYCLISTKVKSSNSSSPSNIQALLDNSSIEPSPPARVVPRRGIELMSFLQLSNGSIHYEMLGPEHAPVLLFSNSLGTDLAMWDPQASALSQEFRVLRYDTRGHGQSAVTPGPY